MYVYLMSGWRLDACKTLRGRIGVARLVGAVIVGHMIHANPSVSSSFNGAELFVRSTFPPVSDVGGTSGWSGHRTSFNIEVLVVWKERSFAPVYLLYSSSGCPIIGFPQCWVHSHRLRLGERNSFCFIVLVNSDGYVIHIKPVDIRY